MRVPGIFLYIDTISGCGVLGGFYGFRRRFLYICIGCSLRGFSDPYKRLLQLVRRLRALCWVSDHAALYGCIASAFPGCSASINPAYSVRLSSGSVRGAVCPGGVFDHAAAVPSIFAASSIMLPGCCQCPPVSGPVSWVPVSGLPGLPGSRRSPSPTKNRKVNGTPSGNKNLTQNEADRESFDFPDRQFLFIQFSNGKNRCTSRACVWLMCASHSHVDTISVALQLHLKCTTSAVTAALHFRTEATVNALRMHNRCQFRLNLLDSIPDGSPDRLRFR